MLRTIYLAVIIFVGLYANMCNSSRDPSTVDAEVTAAVGEEEVESTARPTLAQTIATDIEYESTHDLTDIHLARAMIAFSRGHQSQHRGVISPIMVQQHAFISDLVNYRQVVESIQGRISTSDLIRAYLIRNKSILSVSTYQRLEAQLGDMALAFDAMVPPR